MATWKDWVEGARLRTLPAAAAPVIVGSASAVHLGAWMPGRAALALGVALALQIGVNFSNDYSDGVRGTDDVRSGPPRLTGGGLVAPRVVLGAALGCFAGAGVLGLWLVALAGQWFFVALGAAAVIAAWFYTGGRSPYGYMGVGLSEVMVFVFFGLMATVGTTFTQVASAPWWVWILASGIGLISVALLMVNNIRDIPTDREAGKRTIAVRLGEGPARGAFVSMLAVAVLTAGAGLVGASGIHPGVIVGVVTALALGAVLPCRRVLSGASGRALIPALRDTGIYALVWGVAVGAALVF